MDTGVDLQDSILLVYEGGEMASLCTAMNCVGDTRGVVFGTKGTLSVDSILNTQAITVTPPGKPEEAHTYAVPEQINGFEYEVQAAVDAIEEGKVECEAMPHAETVRIMRLMDDIRAKWGMAYPGE